MQMISLVDALDAMERNIKAFLIIAGETPGYVHARVDAHSGTASISHSKNQYDGKINVMVNFPAMPEQTRISKEELDRWTGYFIHELCHALYTDNVAWGEACREGLNDLVNGMEDVRIEKLFNNSGVAANSFELLNSLLAWVVSELPVNYDPNEIHNLAWIFAMVGRVEVCGYDLPQAEKHIAKLNPAFRALCDSVMPRIDAATCTGDILAIARDLKTQLAPKAKPNQPKPNQSKPEGDKSEGDKSEGDKAVNPNGEGGTGEGTGESKSGKPEGETSAGETGVAGNGGGGNGGGNGGMPEGDVTKQKPVDLSPFTEKQKAEAKRNRNGIEAISDAAVVEGVREAKRHAGSALNRVPEATRGITALVAETMPIAKLRAQVARVLKAEENESWDRGRASGRLDRFALARVGSGHVENVYARRHISGGYETEIEILVDASGSMGSDKQGHPMRTATVLSLAIAQAAQSVGVKCQVSMFSSSTRFPMVAKATNESPSSRSVQARFAGMAKGTTGSTPLTPALIHVATRLAARAPTKRKMVFVVCDGDCDYGPTSIRKACDYAERQGVETVALFIDTAPHNGFRFATQCDSANIAQSGLGALVKALSREA